MGQFSVSIVVNGEVKKRKKFQEGERFSRVHLDLHLMLLELMNILAEEGHIKRDRG